MFTGGFGSYYKTHMLMPLCSPTAGFSNLLRSLPKVEAGDYRTRATEAAAGVPAALLSGHNIQEPSGKQPVLDKANSFGAYYKNHVLVPPYPANTGFEELFRKMDRSRTTEAAAGAAAVSSTGSNVQDVSGKQPVLDNAKSFGAYYRNHVLVPPYPVNTGFVELLRNMQDGKGPTQKQTT